MLAKIRHYVDKNTIRSFYFSLFHCQIDYCCQVWGQKGNSYLNRVLSLQRSALRIISFKPFRSDVSCLFRSLNIHLFSNTVHFANLLFVFDSLSSNLPTSILIFFSLSRNSHAYITRNGEHNKLVLPKFYSVKYGKKFSGINVLLNRTDLLPTSIQCFSKNMETL